MQLTKGQIYDAVTGLINIGQRMKMIPQTAKYKLAKMHEILEPFYIRIRGEENALIQELGSEKLDEKGTSMGWGITENSPEHITFLTRWKAIREDVLEIPITPITLFSLGDDPKGLEVGEFKLLGPLVIETPGGETPR